jgi:hypothetical protein
MPAVGRAGLADRSEKRRAVEGALRADGPRLSDREIARRCGVHHKLVGLVRRELSGPSEAWRPGALGPIRLPTGTAPPVKRPPPTAPEPGERPRRLLDRVVEASRVAARRRQLDYRDLSARTGFSPDTVQRCLSGSRPYLRVLHALDRLLAPRLDPADRWAIEGAYAAVGLPPAPAPSAHPLVALLGPDWRWIGRPEAGTAILLDEAGAWTEISLVTDYSLAVWHQVAETIKVRLGSPGQFVLEVSRAPVGWAVRAVPARRTDCLSGPAIATGGS